MDKTETIVQLKKLLASKKIELMTLMLLLMETVLLKMRSFIYNPMRHILYVIILYQTQKAMPLSLRPIQEEP